MNAIKLLKADHRKVEELFSRLESSRGQAKLRVFEQIKAELELHTHIEEKLFYPAVEEPEETHDLTLEAYEEHNVVKKLLKELSRAKSASDEWEAKAKVLQENVEHHVEEEENELFPKTQKVLSEEDLADLGDRMAAEKERKQGAGRASKSSKSARGNKSAAKTSAVPKAAKRTPGSKKSGATKSTKRSRSKKSAARKR